MPTHPIIVEPNHNVVSKLKTRLQEVQMAEVCKSQGIHQLHLGVHALHLSVHALHLGVHVLHLGVHVLHLGVHVLHLGVHALHLVIQYYCAT